MLTVCLDEKLAAWDFMSDVLTEPCLIGARSIARDDRAR